MSESRVMKQLTTQLHAAGITYSEAVLAFERSMLQRFMEASRGNQCAAAKVIGIHRNSLARLLERVGLDHKGNAPRLRYRPRKKPAASVSLLEALTTERDPNLTYQERRA